MKPPLITGQTPDGKPVVYSSLFQWKDQEGVPLDMAAALVLEKGYVIDWLYEIEGALWLGYTHDRILADLKEVFLFVYPEARNELLEKAKLYLRIRETPNAYTLKAMKATKI